MICVRSLPSTPPVGTRCFYRNDALRLEGWGHIVAPLDPIDAEEYPILLPWVGILTGPRNEGQAALDRLAPGCGVFPAEERYVVVPAHLLWVDP